MVDDNSRTLKTKQRSRAGLISNVNEIIKGEVANIYAGREISIFAIACGITSRKIG